MMNISVQKCLAKMEDELRLAKRCAGEGDLKEKIYSIKVLCELILGEKPEKEAPLHPAKPKPPEQHPLHTSQSGIDLQPQKVEFDDANGESLLDF